MAQMGSCWSGRVRHPCASWDMHPARSCSLLTPPRPESAVLGILGSQSGHSNK